MKIKVFLYHHLLNNIAYFTKKRNIEYKQFISAVVKI